MSHITKQTELFDCKSGYGMLVSKHLKESARLSYIHLAIHAINKQQLMQCTLF